MTSRRRRRAQANRRDHAQLRVTECSAADGLSRAEGAIDLVRAFEQTSKEGGPTAEVSVRTRT